MNFKSIVFIILVGFVISACKKSSESDSSTLNANESNLELLSSDQTGLDFENTLTDTKDLNIVEYLYYYNGGGVAIGDINQDGLEDVFLTSNQGSNKLYLNKGSMKFEDVTAKSGIKTNKGWSTGVSMDDVNNDGLLDIYVCKVAPLSKDSSVHNELYINKGDGTFEESAQALGVAFKGYSTQTAFLDYDHDGDLDMYLLNHTVHSISSYGDIKKRKLTDPLSGDVLYENRLNQEGKFVDVSKKAGIYTSPLGYGLAIAPADLNGDGWTDIYVGNDFHENDYIYINNKNGTFTESVASLTAHTSQFSMGVDVADMNGDGLADIFTTDMLPCDEVVAMQSAGEDTDNIKRIKKDLGFEGQSARNHFLLNNGANQFSDVAYITRTFATDWSWSVLLQDFDNDGKRDIFISNGIVKRPNDLDYINYLNEMDSNTPNDTARTRKLISKMPSQKLANLLFKNTGDLTYTSLDNAGVGKPSFSTGAAYADLDNDGDLDIITNNINEKAFVYQNKGTKGYNSIRIALTDTSKTTVKGAKVTLWSGGNQLVAEVQTVKGFMSSSSHNLLFGLGSASKIDSAWVAWPDGTTQDITTLKVNELNTIMKGGSSNSSHKTNYIEQFIATSLMPYIHSEDGFYDENSEKLIPERLSYEGPALVVDDFTGDGIKDIFMGAGRDNAPKFLVGQKDGSFKEMDAPGLKADAKYDDVAAASIDFDNDGDRDLYVVSGGNDHPELNALIEDRLYINNGGGVFKRVPISLPITNGGTIAVGDFDKDGYEDLFIGARSMPNYYGLSPYSFILKNSGGKGVELILKERFGMLTDSKWADVDGDNDLDLILCGDWMPITVMSNEGKGIFKETTVELGLATKTGFWNTVSLYDYNKDGMLDIVAGNAGLNHKWTATAEHPINLYIGDFDKNGATDPVIFYHYFNRYMPFASLDKMVSHIPMLKKNFANYGQYTKVASIDQLLPKYKENLVELKTVNELQSMLFLSDNGKYQAVPLGKKEQMSDINATYINKQGQVLYIGNFNEYVSEQGMSAANGGRLLGDFDIKTNMFKSNQPLALPLTFSGRKIAQVEENKYVLAANKGNLYTVNLNK